jgi:hypothetical protein
MAYDGPKRFDSEQGQRELPPAGQAGVPSRAPHSSALPWLREPLIHFIVLGTALFLLWPLIAARVAPPTNHIVISSGQMQRAIEIFISTHTRPPTEAEIASLAEQEIRAEVEYREGVAMGLDRDDEIIRRRIAQKLRFMIEDVAEQATPSDAELQKFLDQNRDEFGAEQRFAFSQIYLNPARHADLAHDASTLLAQLNQADGRLDYAADSDTLPVPNDFEAARPDEISSMFGADFAAAIATLKPGQWAGPIHSGYGDHLVLVRKRIQGAPPRLAQVRDAVLREYQSARRVAANEAAYRQMRAKYTVQVEMPAQLAPAPATGEVAE